MRIIQVTDRSTILINELIVVWESSVRATHKFLDEESIQGFKKELPQIIKNVPILIVALNDDDKPLAFMGMTKREIDMLFVSDTCRGKGIGKKLILFAFSNFNANKVNVNEQNPQAVGFYQHMGFEVYDRTEKDDAGNPYPILYMRKKESHIKMS
ncbi:GNAT family N-acetyltransferase [Companilactobacillus musae]|uniref:GNAT family N-acetyltransferase n=1 Tax=Companilactobacillus musae TaxID=1903258 RepID=UPI000E655D15|nr:GNAT family N-acetyltransferase [Companilactobacillus musae]